MVNKLYDLETVIQFLDFYIIMNSEYFRFSNEND